MNRFRYFKSWRVAVAVPSFLMAAAVGVTVGAAPVAAAGRGDVVVYEEPGVVVTIPNPQQRTKNELRSRPGGEVGTESHCGTQCYLFPSDARTITPPGGSSGTIRSDGQTNYVPYVVPILGNVSKMDFYNTISSSSWLGSSPYNCTSVKHQDVWDIDYVGVGFSFGGGPSGSVGLGSGKVGYSNTVSNTWRVTHNVSHIYLAVTGGGGSIFWTGYEVHGSYQFGSSFFTTDGYSGAWLAL